MREVENRQIQFEEPPSVASSLIRIRASTGVQTGVRKVLAGQESATEFAAKS